MNTHRGRPKIEIVTRPERRSTMTADEIDRSFPNIADWIQGSGWIEIGNHDWQGFVVRALTEGGEVIEVERCKSLGEALIALEAEIPKAET